MFSLWSSINDMDQLSQPQIETHEKIKYFHILIFNFSYLAKRQDIPERMLLSNILIQSSIFFTNESYSNSLFLLRYILKFSKFQRMNYLHLRYDFALNSKWNIYIYLDFSACIRWKLPYFSITYYLIFTYFSRLFPMCQFPSHIPPPPPI
jgi:hypothetical protein